MINNITTDPESEDEIQQMVREDEEETAWMDEYIKEAESNK